MARLKKSEKVFIVRCLAQFMTPTEVVRDIKEKFNIDVTPQQVEYYDPTKVAGANLPDEFSDIFHEARTQYLAQPLHNIIGANDLIQLQILSDLLMSKKGNVALAIKIIDQIQKIVKGHYERKIEITGKDGAPLQTTVVQATPEQVEAAVRKAQEEY
ncbi:DUF2280 domain-containing protein [Acinetobacter ursingii]|uniref:DUF2280 domain-containing protein n=1 Tax=Acinetobacter ursingii TaxID=108980 RepID=UPI003AF4D316